VQLSEDGATETVTVETWGVPVAVGVTVGVAVGGVPVGVGVAPQVIWTDCCDPWASA
jgi:hypothetical protein